MRPQTLDVLLYLDDITDLNGPLSVVPGSPDWIDKDLPRDQFDDLPGQVTLRLPAGSLGMCHGALWHRALHTQPGGTLRRLLLRGYGPGWIKSSIYGEKPENGLTEQLLQNADEETRELLGHAGFM